MKVRSLAVAALFFVCPCADGLNPSLDTSQYAHTTWKIRNGFTKGVINSIAQTPDGYLWLGTEFGLLRFDGVRAVPWQPAAGEQLPSNYIRALLVTRDGTLWISTWMGLASWKDGRLTQYPEIAGQHILPLMEDREGTVWFGAAQPGRVCAIQEGKVHCYGAGSFGNWVGALYQDRTGNLWLSAQTGVWRWAPGPPERYPYPRVAEVNSVIEADSGTLLLASSDGLQQLAEGRIQSYVLPGTTGKFRPDRLLRSSDGSLWIGSNQGLLHLHQGRIDRFGATDGLSGNYVEHIFEDHEGNVWVTTLDGLDRFGEFAVPTISRNEGLSSSAPYSVQATPDGSIWIGSLEGLNRWQNGQMTLYVGSGARQGKVGEPINDSSASARSTPKIADSGLEGEVRSLGQDDRGRLRVTTSDGVFFFENGRFTRVRGVAGGNIFSIAADGHGGAWILDGGADLLHLDPDGDVQHIPWPHARDRYWGVLLPDRLNGGLWLGFTDGGIAYLKDGRVLAAYDQADGLGHGYVSDLRLGSDGAVWVATESGLSRLKDGRITALTSKNGMPCNALDWVMEDDHWFWLYMQCGLVRIARSELALWVRDPRRVVETTVFDSSDGVRSSGRFGGYGPHVTKSPDGRIWFVPGDGVSVIDPRNLPFNKLPPPVHIQQIMADRKSYDATTARHLPALTHDLEIDYTALSYVAPEKNRFQYKLEGYDRDWIDAGNRRQAFYTKLPPRGYTFRVKASNNSGVWNEAGASFIFSVDPAYYQTVWFRTLCAAAFLTLLWA
ncbi:MAG: hypothetical protein JOY54_21645, partial [Acidobacteriaceae bacterium]|nr:hypothetical protein [Acidobacteriaceae bacterium]